MPLREVHWEVTTSCNLHCTHCLPGFQTPRANELSTAEALQAVELFAELGAEGLYLTGGEPWIRRDLKQIIRRAAKLGLNTAMISNATLLDEDKLRWMKSLEVGLSVSLEGADAVINDAVRGRGTFEKVIRVLKWCREIGLEVGLYVTIHRGNFQQLGAIQKLAREYGCVSLHFSELNLGGNALQNTADLALSFKQSEEVSQLSFSPPDQSCWVDGTSLNVTSAGELYPCVEVFQQNPRLSLGNIRELTADKLAVELARLETPHGKCCYAVQAGSGVSLISNQPIPCAYLIEQPTQYTTLAQLYDALDILYKDIQQYCRECEHPDCLGYVWLLDNEARRLQESGVALVRVNNGLTFIHSFSEDERDMPNLSQRYPPCVLRCESGECTIHPDRPLVCRMYPLGLETTTKSQEVWALHTDCLFVEALQKRGLLDDFKQSARVLLSKLSPELEAEILQTYRAVDAISAFPNGENEYEIVREVN